MEVGVVSSEMGLSVVVVGEGSDDSDVSLTKDA